MKSIKLILTLIFFISTVNAQDNLPVIKSNVSVISIQDGEQLKRNSWKLNPELKPDIYEAELINGKPHKVTFITDVDQISFTVEEGKKYDFIIQCGEQLCYQQIIGTRFVPAAIFDKKYQAKHRGKILVETPEVYELVNIAIAMTPKGIEDRNLIYKNSDYYKRVRQWFDKYQNHPLLAALDGELKKDYFNYHHLKMNGYSFVFDKNNKIVQSKVYNRSGWGRTNHLRPFIAQLQSFSDVSNFRRFYKQNRKTYQEQAYFYRNTADVAEMKRWLDKNFPTSNNYDVYKIIFSPLVHGHQSSASFENNGFKELHPHVNFPYAQDLKLWIGKDSVISKQAEAVFRGNIVFTEINHGYIGPEGNKYSDRIMKAISNRDKWVDKKMGENYYSGNSAFDEYMNWGLVSLRIVDYVPREEQDKLIAVIDRWMSTGRGFPQFGAFDKFLVDLYRNRKPGQTVADLYPQIIEWFEENNKHS